MKVAGRKNDGAWYRTNKAIFHLEEDEKSALQVLILASDFIDNAFQAISDFTAYAGLDPDTVDGIAASAADWANKMAFNGIPRQVWFGVLSWDSYTKVDDGLGNFTYTPDHSVNFRLFAQDLRKILKKFMLARRQVLDLSNFGLRSKGNVGGIADGQRGD